MKICDKIVTFDQHQTFSLKIYIKLGSKLAYKGEEMEYYMPPIPYKDFLPIFVVSAMVIILGMMYAGFFTLVKLKLVKKFYMVFAYLSWLALVAAMYYLGQLLRVEPYTQKVLIGAMFGYLVFPHIVYFLLEKVHQRYEHSEVNS